MSTYGYSKTFSGDFDSSVARTTDALAKEGFGVLTTIDLKSKLKEKLNVTVDDYMILGTCSPKHAYQALQVEHEIGLLLPCNVIVYRKGNDVVVAVQLPTAAMQITGNEKLDGIAREVEAALRRVIDDL